MDTNNAILNFLLEYTTIENILKFIVLYFFIVWIAILVWVIRDIINRTENIFLQVFSILSILFLTPLGVFIYLIIRPGKTLFEKYYEEVEHNLDCLSEEIKEKIGADNFEKITCFNCKAEIEKEFKYCPSCSVKLMKKCNDCGRELELDRKNCPYCGGKKKNKK